MVFSSVVFIFVFLPATLFLYYLTRSDSIRNWILLFSSLVFYAWGETSYVFVMIGSIVLGWLFGQLLVRFKSYQKWVLLAGVSSMLAVLIFYKYANFMVQNWNQLCLKFQLPFTIQHKLIHLPIGVSFFTFQVISYLIDIYRGEVKPQSSIIKMGVYKSFFPQLIAGPIVRYRDISKEISRRKVAIEDLSYGLRRFTWGLAQKVLIANTLGAVADQVYQLPEYQLTGVLTWIGALAYSFQIYFDFSGYSHMAIGLARLFGFHFLENFNYPYISQSITDFWRRWHISLSSWFRDYLYIPLGGNRCSPWRTYLNLSIVFLLCGLWHGANWNFAIWGLFHGLLLVHEKLYFLEVLRVIPKLPKIILVNVLVTIGWVFFRSESLDHAIICLKAMFGLTSGDPRWVPVPSVLSVEVIICFFFAFIFSMPTRFERALLFDSKGEELTLFRQIQVLAITFGLFLVTLSYLSNSTFNPFIYYRF